MTRVDNACRGAQIHGVTVQVVAVAAMAFLNLVPALGQEKAGTDGGLSNHFTVEPTVVRETICRGGRVERHTVPMTPEREQLIAWCKRVEDHIAVQSEHRQLANVLGEKHVRCILFVARHGAVKDLRIGMSSGSESIDTLALRLVRRSTPFESLPKIAAYDQGISVFVYFTTLGRPYIQVYPTDLQGPPST